MRWNVAGAIEILGAGSGSVAQDVSADGSVVVGYTFAPGDPVAFRWTSSSGYMPLGDLSGGANSSGAYGISPDGQVIVGAGVSAAGGEGFRWTAAAGMVGLGDLSGGTHADVARATSGDGSVIAGYGSSSNGIEAFRWTNTEGIIGIGDLPGGGFFSEAYDISADGSVVVGRSIANDTLFPSRAFRWTAPEGMVALPDLPNVGPTAIAQGISGDGNVIVGAASAGDFAAAFAWDRFHGTRSVEELLLAQGVDLDGFRLGKASAASFDGLTLVGIGVPRDSFTSQPWIARLDSGTFIPEPSSIGLGAVALLTSLVWWRSAGAIG